MRTKKLFNRKKSSLVEIIIKVCRGFDGHDCGRGHGREEGGRCGQSEGLH